MATNNTGVTTVKSPVCSIRKTVTPKHKRNIFWLPIEKDPVCVVSPDCTASLETHWFVGSKKPKHNLIWRRHYYLPKQMTFWSWMSFGLSLAFARISVGYEPFYVVELVRSLPSRLVTAAKRPARNFGSVFLKPIVVAIVSVISGMPIKRSFLKTLTKVWEKTADKLTTWSVGIVHCVKKLLGMFARPYLSPKPITCIIWSHAGSSLSTT